MIKLKQCGILLKLKLTGKVRQDIFCFSSGNDEIYDYLDIFDSFNDFFLSISDTITLNIKNSNNHNKHKDTNPLIIYHNYRYLMTHYQI